MKLFLSPRFSVRVLLPVLLSCWMSAITHGQSRQNSIALDVAGVQELTFQVEDGGDGKASDWGVWTDLKIERD